jgi:hypothetical protein
MAKRKAKNPGKGSFARCVSAVKRRGGVSDPNAVCAASKRRTKKGARELERASKAARRGNVPHVGAKGKGWRVYWDEPSMSWAMKIPGYGPMLFYTKPQAIEYAKGAAKVAAEKKRGNPAEAATEAYTDFHGRAPDELVKVEKTVHFHRHLAGAGELRKMFVYPEGKLFRVPMKDFNGALLAFNEKRNQLFIEGGNQAVNLKTFGIKTSHEIEVLGELRIIEYYTRKDHLGKDGGTAVYVHKFRSPYPKLLYHTLDKRLEIAGGSYIVPDEGIDR